MEEHTATKNAKTNSVAQADTKTEEEDNMKKEKTFYERQRAFEWVDAVEKVFEVKSVHIAYSKTRRYNWEALKEKLKVIIIYK